jgi:hypothetical protein
MDSKEISQFVKWLGSLCIFGETRKSSFLKKNSLKKIVIRRDQDPFSLFVPLIHTGFQTG